MTILAALGYEAALLVNQLLLMIFALFALVTLIDGDVFQLPVRVVMTDTDDEDVTTVEDSDDIESPDENQTKFNEQR
jgi:hypothetical protein